MNVLLDTHTFLWFVQGSTDLSVSARDLVNNPTTTSFLSMASVWEMAIKISLGKMELQLNLSDFVSHYTAINGFRLLPITLEHTSIVTSVPFHHRDPFDRLLAAQALSEELVLLSRDSILSAYGITRLW